jgi:ribosomal RNA-processing protein 9
MQQSVTCVAVTSDESLIYSGSKDNSVIQWNTETGQKTIIKPKWNKNNSNQCHDGEVLAVAVTSDGKYAVCGGRDNMLRVFDTRIGEEVKSFNGHRDAITSLSFKRDSYSLYSGSLDRYLCQMYLYEYVVMMSILYSLREISY